MPFPQWSQTRVNAKEGSHIFVFEHQEEVQPHQIQILLARIESWTQNLFVSQRDHDNEDEGSAQVNPTKVNNKVKKKLLFLLKEWIPTLSIFLFEWLIFFIRSSFLEESGILINATGNDI